MAKYDANIASPALNVFGNKTVGNRSLENT